MTRAISQSTAWLSTLLLSIGLAQASLAAETSTDQPYSSQQLAVMAGSCANCHGTDGRLVGAVPAIAGRPASALESRLLSFKRDEIEDTTIMNRIAKGYSDEELAALATHFANIDKQ